MAANPSITLGVKVSVGNMNPLPPGWRFRTNWRGKLILQRRYSYKIFCGPSGIETHYAWRDAAVQDFTELLQLEKI